MNNDFLSKEEMIIMGFKNIGNNVSISRKASFYCPQYIEIGDNVRIDDFCILSGKICIGNNVHVSAGCYLFAGDAGIILEDFSSVSSRCAIYAISDDYSGNYMTNSTIDVLYRNVIKKKVIIEKYVVIGTGTTIFPGTKIREGCAIGAMSLINKSTEPWGIYIGIPGKRINERSKELLRFLSK